MRFRRVLRVVVVAASVACADEFGPTDFHGNWGGDNVRLTLTPTQATFESSCWSGELTIPLVIDGPRFESLATLNHQGGAGIPESVIATFTGRLSGDRLRLTVEPTSLGLGPYMLERDAQVSIPGCP